MSNESQQYWLNHGFVLELLKQLPSYVFWKDTKSVYLGCNDAFARALQLSSPQEIVGKTDFDLPTTKEVSAAYQADDREVMQSGKAKLNIEEPQVFVDGTKKVLLTNKVPLRDKNNKIIGILGIYTDITDRKRAEEALKAQIKKTEEAYHSKTEFLSIASHEIRSPIGNVISLLDFVKQQCDKLSEITNEFVESSLDKSKKTEVIQINNKLAEYYDEVKAEAYRALNALINLGDLHRLQIEGIKCRFEMYGIIDLVEKAITNSTYPNSRKVDLRLNVQPTVPKEVMMDWNNIYEALRVIIGNAIRFSKSNDVVNIQVITEQENEKNYFVVTVQDNGVGISESQLSHLLKTTLDEEDMETRRFRKPSLQLPQAKMRVEASGGQMQIKSIVNKGTTVILKIPYQNESALFADAKSLKANKADHAQYMLLIEDDLLAQRIEKNYLENLGHRVDTAATGAEAIRLATTNSYDIIWLDITLPDMNGVNAMQKIREKIGDKIPFVAITSHASEDNIDYFISQDVMTVLTKPVTEQQFRDCIEDVLAAKQEDDQDDE